MDSQWSDFQSLPEDDALENALEIALRPLPQETRAEEEDGTLGTRFVPTKEETTPPFLFVNDRHTPPSWVNDC